MMINITQVYWRRNDAKDSLRVSGTRRKNHQTFISSLNVFAWFERPAERRSRTSTNLMSMPMMSLFVSKKALDGNALALVKASSNNAWNWTCRSVANFFWTSYVYMTLSRTQRLGSMNSFRKLGVGWSGTWDEQAIHYEFVEAHDR